MRLLPRAVLLILIMSSPVNITAAHADECTARVEHAGTTILGSKIYTYWRLGHRPWRWATVSFRYRLKYVDENNKEKSMEGEFRRIVSGEEEKYTELKNARNHPLRVILTDYSDLKCQK